MKTLGKLHLMLALSMIFFLGSCEVEPIDIPDEDARDAYIGTWSCTDTQVKSAKDSYSVSISYDPSNSAQVLLRNFGFLGQDVEPYAIVTGTIITIPEQTTSGDYIISASGKLVGKNKIEWNYTTNDGADELNYKAVFSR